jgi:uncharacterized protein
MRFVVFFVVLFTLLGGINWYAYRRATQAFAFSTVARRTLASIFAVSILGMLFGRIADRVWAEAPVGPLLAVSSTLQLAILLSFVFLVLTDGARLVALLWGRFGRSRQAEAPATLAPAPEISGATIAANVEQPRRTFLSQAAAGSAFLIGGSSALYGALHGRHDYAIEEVPVKLPGLSRALDGFTIVQLSDIHIGQFVGEPELAAAEDLIRKARPDLIVLTGDLLDHDPRLAHRLGRFARRVGPLAREGVVAISGNHDFFAGIEPTVAALEAGGATVLRNRGRVIGDGAAGFALLGVDDVWAARAGRGGGPDLKRSIRSLPLLGGKVAAARDLPRVLLCHNPVFFEESAGQVALQLSGHTHGGQVNFVVRPADWVLKNGWVAGSYDRNGSRLYINRGFGTVGPPARLGAPPEITRIVLEA